MISGTYLYFDSQLIYMTQFDASLELGLGTGRLSSGQECIDTVARALELGYRHIDTARTYNNESDIRTAVERADIRIEDVFLATKIHSKSLTPNDIVKSINKSRSALNVDTLDLIYIHWPAHTYEANKTLPTLNMLRSEGYIRHIGLSNFTIKQVKEAQRVIEGPIDFVQAEIHPFLQQNELQSYTKQHDIRLVAHTPLCQGLVLDHPSIVSIAEKHGITGAQVVLAWLLAKEHVAAIPTSRGPHLEENLGSHSVSLDESDIQKIGNISETHRCIDYEFAPWSNSESKPE